ncbi:RloB family protein [Vibrio cholerae]|uniref:RloB family protein n=1 Tax=Vibrio cholerae TaxID=666 RepID=UPI001C2F6791|nr:RloB family protein [Vibrio cholerae]
MPKKKGGNKKVVKPAFRIYCEGEKTEPLYIKAYIDHFHSEHRGLIVVEDTRKNTPVQLVDTAVKDKKSGNSNDIYWVVYDRESQTKYSDDLHLKARKKAKDNGIEIAISNVCFEYWFLLHFVYTNACYDSCDELLRQSQLKKHLKDVGIDSYDKGLALIFDKLRTKIPDALKNAKKLKEAAHRDACVGKNDPCQLNPYIDVHELFLDMEQFSLGKESIRKK